MLILGSCAATEYQIVNQQVVQVKNGETVGVEGEMGAIMHGCLAFESIQLKSKTGSKFFLIAGLR